MSKRNEPRTPLTPRTEIVPCAWAWSISQSTVRSEPPPNPYLKRLAARHKRCTPGSRNARELVLNQSLWVLLNANNWKSYSARTKSLRRLMKFFGKRRLFPQAELDEQALLRRPK